MGFGQPGIQTTWNSLHAFTYWGIRLSVAGATKDAQVQNEIFLSYFTCNLAVVRRKLYSDLNFASYGSSGPSPPCFDASACRLRPSAPVPPLFYRIGCGVSLAFAPYSSLLFLNRLQNSNFVAN